MDVPDFDLESYEPASGCFDRVSLKKLLKEQKWPVLVFYPADFTFVCPTELADLAQKRSIFDEFNAAIIAVSTDTKFSHLAWRKSEKLLQDVTYSMAADPTGELARRFGVYDAATGLCLRGTFIINPSGRLVSAEVNSYNLGRNAHELCRKLQAARHVFDHPEEACPAAWVPGEKALTPSEGLVGHVFEYLKAA